MSEWNHIWWSFGHACDLYVNHHRAFLQSNKLDKPEKSEVSDNVKVVVRCRPLNQKEKVMGYKQSVTVDEIRGTITVNKTETPNDLPKTFTFDTVFGPESKQLDVYNLTARPIIDSVLEGYNGMWYPRTVFTCRPWTTRVMSTRYRLVIVLDFCTTVV